MPDAPDQAPASRRDFLATATFATAGIGTLLALWPFVDSINPAADVLAESSTDIDISPLAVGQRITVAWRGRPVFVVRRTAAEITAAQQVDIATLRDPQSDGDRVLKPDWLIVVGICTHLGCVPLGQKPGDPRGQYGGWFCPCHGSIYDGSGRIRGGPAPKNLVVPPYTFVDAHTLRIGGRDGPKAVES